MRQVFEMKKIFIALLCFLLIICGTTAAASALTIALDPREIDLDDGLIFRMALSVEEENTWIETGQAGLYRDGELIYAVDIDAGWWWRTLYFSDDAMTFFSVPWSTGEIRFYEQGVFVHSYDVIDLLQEGRASLIPPHGVVTYSRWNTRIDHDRTNNTLYITTAEDVIITFDLLTGLILSNGETPAERAQVEIQTEEIPAQRNDSMLFIGLGIIVCGMVLLVTAKMKRSK